jgi:hypothetical protein
MVPPPLVVAPSRGQLVVELMHRAMGPVPSSAPVATATTAAAAAVASPMALGQPLAIFIRSWATTAAAAAVASPMAFGRPLAIFIPTAALIRSWPGGERRVVTSIAARASLPLPSRRRR